MIWSQRNKNSNRDHRAHHLMNLWEKYHFCLPVKQCLVTGYQFRQLEKLILRLKILFPSLEFLQRHDWFCVFNSCMCESLPSLFPSAELAAFSPSPCGAPRSLSLLWSVSRPLALWNFLALSHLMGALSSGTLGERSLNACEMCALVKRLFHNFREN